MTPRPYQRRAIDGVRSAWAAGALSVLLVAPTGAGKTFLGQELIGESRTLWVAHRRELVLNGAKRLREELGEREVGVIMPGEYETPSARIQVGTVQTLIARGRLPAADLVVLDEAHHYMADEWRALTESHPGARCLGLTATPERKDGEALGDIFQVLVVAAKYSELIADGFLVPARVYQPPKNLGNDLAQEPLAAWLKYSEGSRTFGFCGRVEIGYGWAKQFRDAGHMAQVVEAMTPTTERDEHMDQFRAGRVRVLWNCFTLTEGVDVPEARCAVLARAFGHVGAYLQAVGRVLRPARDKSDAIVIDLCGATLRHGLPTQDREYSLSGRAISGGTNHAGGGSGEFSQSVRGLELRSAGGEVSLPTPVAVEPIDDSERRAEFIRLRDLARQHGMRDGFAAAKFREKFGEWPRREWA
jgi:DNA repair protein RadD